MVQLHLIFNFFQYIDAQNSRFHQGKLNLHIKQTLRNLRIS